MSQASVIAGGLGKKCQGGKVGRWAGHCCPTPLTLSVWRGHPRPRIGKARRERAGRSVVPYRRKRMGLLDPRVCSSMCTSGQRRTLMLRALAARVHALLGSGRRDIDRRSDRNVRPTQALPAMLLVLLVNVGVGHAGDVVADHAGQRLGLGFGFFLVAAWELVGMRHP